MRRILPTPFFALPLLLLTAPATAQSVVHFLPDGGGTVVRIDDFDQDGIDDFADRSGDGVRVRSGATAALLRFIDTSGMYGHSLAACGDLDHDGVPDLVLGDALATLPSGANVGGVVAFSGATGTVLWMAHGSADADSMGWNVGAAGDANADGTPDVLGQAWQYKPPFSGPGYVRLLSGVDGSLIREWVGAFPGAASFGHGLGTIGDFNGDGHDDQLVGELSENGGAVYLYSGADGNVLKVFDPPVDGEFGRRFDGGRDINGDGVRDLVAGAQGWNGGNGRVVVLSGADSSILVDVPGTVPNQTWLGQDVDFLDDVNGDGVPEVVTGGLFLETLPNAASYLMVISGADSSILAALAVPELGTVAGLDDLDGDGSPEFAAGAGGVIVFSFVGDPPTSYCPAKTNSQGCMPAADWSGTASLTGPADFHLSCTGMINQMRGALMWSAAASAPPYQGGTLCLAAPWQPVAPFSSGGSLVGVDCSGSASVHLTQTFLTGTGALPGTTLYAQFFYRDRFHPDGSGLGLSDGVSFELLP